MSQRCVFLEKQIGNQLISLSISQTSNSFSATIQNSSGSIVHLNSSQIKCGISGRVSHHDFIRRVDQIARDKLVAFIYPSEEKPVEILIFEASPLAAPLIKKAKEYLKQDQFDEAINQLETALKLEQQQNGNTAEQSSTTLELRKELFLLRTQRAQKNARFYLTPEAVADFNGVVGLHEGLDNLFHSLTHYLETVGLQHPHLYYLSALLNEHAGKIVEAAPTYLYLALKHPSPLHCLKKAAEIIKGASDPLAFPHFLERLDREWLSQVSKTTQDPELKRWVLLKDAFRMAFEECLAELSRSPAELQSPTCFICFNVEERDVAQWLEQTLVPDLDRIGIKPLFCFRDLGPGKELNNFQALIRNADQVIIACTPELKRKYVEREKAPTGVAQEIRIARERYNDRSKHESIFPLYLKGKREASCPSPFFEPILGTHLTCFDNSTEDSVFSYYAQAFELLGGMRKIQRERSREMKVAFIAKVKNILSGEIDVKNLDEWRQSRVAKVEAVLKSVQVRVVQKTQMVNLPEAPKDFTGRTQELKELHEACRNNSRVAVIGLGGVGKTALALQYANDHMSDYQFIHFMPAGDSPQVIEGFLKLADDLHIPQTDNREERLLRLKTALDRFEQNYLLIFDGLDQIEAFEEAAKYLPQRGHCLLLTTRMPQQSKIRGFELIELKPFTLEEAVSYLLKATGSQEEAAAKALAEKLGKLPLALTHAARYIDSQKITIQRYIELFNEYELKLFEKDYLELTKEERTILTTWKISIDAIEKKHQCFLAKEILEMFAFLGQAPIPRELIESWFKESHSQSSGFVGNVLSYFRPWFYPSRSESSHLDLGNALKHLIGYSMISSSSPNSYSIHLLVQSVTRYQMPQNRQQKVFEQALTAMTLQMNRLDQKDVTTWIQPKLCMPHAITLFERQNLMLSIFSETFQFMISLGKICRLFGNSHQVLKVNQRCLDYLEKWGRENPDNKDIKEGMAVCLNDIGLALQTLGKADEALEKHRQALKIFQAIYGKSHHDVAMNLNEIGLALLRLGKADEALENYRQALKILQTIYGESHPDVAMNLNSIGLALKTLGKADEALEKHRQALKIFQAIYGKSHPKVADSLDHIGLALRDLGKADEALENYRQALKIFQAIYGESHPKVASSLNNIGYALRDLGRAQEAQDCFQKALKILQAIYGESHPDVASSLNNIGYALRDLGKAQEAQDCFQKALEILQDIYGESHPYVATSLINIGSALKAMRKVKEALKFFQRALEILLPLYGPMHPEVKKVQTNIQSINSIPFSYLRDHGNWLIYDLPSGELIFEGNREQRVKAKSSQKPFSQAVNRLAITRAALAENYEFKTASWKPDQGIDSFLKTLRSIGPFIIQGKFGRNYYEKPPNELLKEDLPKKIKGWSKGADRLSISQTHFVIIVGCLKDESAAGGGYVYFVDPQDPSDPEKPQEDILYRISYQNLQTYAITIEQTKGYTLYL